MGFLIDAVATWFGFLALAARQVSGGSDDDRTQEDYLAEFNNRAIDSDPDPSGLSLVVWTLKREVRASGECLGMYRR